MLGASDPLPYPPRRILVAGVSGSGKSTLARRIAARLDLRYTEIDSLFHGPDWTPRPSFLGDVEKATSGSGWVIEWQYPQARALLLERADTLVWLDHPTSVSLLRVVRRTIRRSLTHETLWNGNVEPPMRSIFTEPENNVIRWAISTRSSFRELVPVAEASHPEIVMVRLSSQREVDRWIASL